MLGLSTTQLVGGGMVAAGVVWLGWSMFGDSVTEKFGAIWKRGTQPGEPEKTSIVDARAGIDVAMRYAMDAGNVDMEECLRAAGMASYDRAESVDREGAGEGRRAEKPPDDRLVDGDADYVVGHGTGVDDTLWEGTRRTEPTATVAMREEAEISRIHAEADLMKADAELKRAQKESEHT